MSTHDLTVYHDGSCPVCRMEIGRYRRSVGAHRIEFVDVSDPRVDPGDDLPREKAMGRFHVRMPSGELKAGVASAFIEIWQVLTFWRPAAVIASLPGATPALELGYRFVSPCRPAVALSESRPRITELRELAANQRTECLQPPRRWKLALASSERSESMASEWIISALAFITIGGVLAMGIFHFGFQLRSPANLEAAKRVAADGESASTRVSAEGVLVDPSANGWTKHPA